MTSGENLGLTSEEKISLEELRKRVSGEINKEKYDETHLLCRFLKARNWNVEEAEKMIRKWLLWRKENRIDFLAKEYKESDFLKMYLKNMLIGHDKEGNSIVYYCLGKWDVAGFHMSAKYPDIEKSALKLLEESEQRAEEQSKKLKRNVPGFIVIVDTAGLRFANATNKKGLQTFITLARIMQENYPERMKTAYVINAASYFTLAFNLVKNFLAEGLIEKFKIYGADGWQEELLKAIDADQLPAFLGGKRTDPDGNPLCKTIVNHTGPVDESYYIHKSKSSLSGSPHAKKLVLTRASFEEIQVPVSVPNSLLEWEFEIRNRDVGFGLFYKDKEETITELVPLRRLETEDFSEAGVMKCETPGNYVVVFDNSYSWIRSKEILYRIQVISPDESENCLQTFL